MATVLKIPRLANYDWSRAPSTKFTPSSTFITKLMRIRYHRFCLYLTGAAPHYKQHNVPAWRQMRKIQWRSPQFSYSLACSNWIKGKVEKLWNQIKKYSVQHCKATPVQDVLADDMSCNYHLVVLAWQLTMTQMTSLSDIRISSSVCFHSNTASPSDVTISVQFNIHMVIQWCVIA